MIAKLIKYDFNALKKPIGLTWIISLGITILFSLGIHFLPPGLAVTSLLFHISSSGCQYYTHHYSSDSLLPFNVRKNRLFYVVTTSKQPGTLLGKNHF